MIVHRTEGLMTLPGHSRTKQGWLYLTNNYEVIEYPTIWAADVAKRGSKSPETLGQYGSTLSRWLRFLDDNRYGAESWIAVDKDVVEHFIETLIQGRDELGRPGDDAIEDYCSRIFDFYRGAAKAGYSHCMDMNNEEVKRVIKDKTKTTKEVVVTGFKKEVTLGYGQANRINKEMNQFVHQQDLKLAMGLFDDYVYAVMAYVIRNTALRPKELLQLPYKGKGLNLGLQHYRLEQAEEIDAEGITKAFDILVTDDAKRDLVTGDIMFEFESKGKRRSIPFPLHVWMFICKVWMPLRNKRAQLYGEIHGLSPSDDCLFFCQRGRPVTYTMLWDHFKKIKTHPGYVDKPFTPKMLRHSWATYFVYEALKEKNRLNSDYVYDSVNADYMRKFMGHTDVETTYKHYVHVVQVYTRKDVMQRLIEEADSELNSIVVALAN